VPVENLADVPGVGPVVASADGQVSQVDPQTLRLREIAKLPGPLDWLGSYFDPRKKRQTIIAVRIAPAQERKGELLTLYQLGNSGPTATTHPLTRPFPIGRIGSIFLDRKSRLWLGCDTGEWGGWSASLDLNAERPNIVETQGPAPAGVYGYLGLPDGQVWAYGGLLHLGASRGFIARVDRGKFEVFAEYGSYASKPSRALPSQPRFPITHMLLHPRRNAIWVFSYRDLFLADIGLKKWKHIGLVELHYRWGRPDAVGAYPAIRTVLSAGADSEELICATQRDGLVRILDGKATPHLVPGQLGMEYVSDILPAASGTVLNGSEPWQYAQGQWRPLPVTPPAPLADGERWFGHRIMLDKAGTVVILSRTNQDPGQVALTRWEKGKPLVLGGKQKQNSMDWSVRGAFNTPDGKFWCAEKGRLLRFEDGQWLHAGTAPESYFSDLRAVDPEGPPWVIHGEECLLLLTPGQNWGESALKPVTLPTAVGKVYDALALARGKLLLATDAGLRVFNKRSATLTFPDFKAPSAKVRALCRDGKGRVWLAGGGIWMVDGAGTVHSFEKITLIGGPVWTVGADSDCDEGVIVSLGRRGVLILRTEARDR
jgi:hypothetical protein